MIKKKMFVFIKITNSEISLLKCQETLSPFPFIEELKYNSSIGTNPTVKYAKYKCMEFYNCERWESFSILYVDIQFS